MDGDVGPRGEAAVLVGVAVDRVVEEVGADAAVVQQGVALAGGAVAGDARPLALGRDQEVQQLALGLGDPLAEAGVGLGRLQAGGQLPLQQGPDPLADRRPVGALVPAPDPQRAAVAGQLVDVEQGDPVPGEDPLGGPEREVGEVLVVDGVELVAVHQPGQVGELDRDHPAGGEQQLDAGHEVVQVGHLGEHVVGRDQVGPAALGGQLAGQLDAEEPGQGGHAPLLGGRGHVHRRLDAQHRHPHGHEVLQQVAVVAGQLHDQAARAEPEPVGGDLGVALGVPDPGVGVGGEVGVLGEDRLGGDVALQLDQPAALADVGPQRVERLHLVALARGQEALAQRRHAEVADHPGDRGGAESAGVAPQFGSHAYSAALRLRSAAPRSVTSPLGDGWWSGRLGTGPAEGRGLSGTGRGWVNSGSSGSASGAVSR